MSIFWPVFWFGLVLSSIVATIVVAIMEQSKRKAAVKALESSQNRVDQGEDIGEALDASDGFPAEENFEFSEIGNR